LPGALVALSLVATACGPAGDGPAAESAAEIESVLPVDTLSPPLVRTETSAPVEAGAGNDIAAPVEADSGSIIAVPVEAETYIEPPSDLVTPEYGDSLDDWHAADATSANRPAVEVRPGFRSVEWEELVPPGFSSDEIYEKYKDRLLDLKPGSPKVDELYDEMNDEYNRGSVNAALDSEDIQLAGFVAPLTYDGDTITEFLLVPYFGACIHVPPPPTNQTVIVTLADGEGLTLDESWGAVWVAGTMTAASTDTGLATAGYSISDAEFGVYENQ